MSVLIHCIWVMQSLVRQEQFKCGVFFEINPLIHTVFLFSKSTMTIWQQRKLMNGTMENHHSELSRLLVQKFLETTMVMAKCLIEFMEKFKIALKRTKPLTIKNLQTLIQDTKMQIFTQKLTLLALIQTLTLIQIRTQIQIKKPISIQFQSKLTRIL